MNIGLPICVRLFIKRTPWLYRPAKHLMDRRAKYILCNRATDLCIEGYESTGNSFSYALLRLAFGRLGIAHHCHSVANLKLALDYDVPTVCLIRDPDSAISSRLARFGGSHEQALAEYLQFYSFVFQHIDRIAIVTFEELTQDPRKFLKRITEQIGVEGSFDQIQDLEKRAKERVKSTAAERGTHERVSLPLESRERAKSQIQTEIKESRYYPEALAVWQQIMKRVKSAERVREEELLYKKE